jgi:prepilin-type N-terminal cleavage/methylation domain-containing protein
MKRLKTMVKSQVGLTLIELLIALAITGIITGTVTMITFQVFDGEARANNHLDALSRVQNAGREISRDAGMAQIVDWPEGYIIRLTWYGWEDDKTHRVDYSIENDELKREYYTASDPGGIYNLESSYIFEYVNCELNPGELDFVLTATVGIGSQQASEQRVYSVTPRPSI